MGLDLGLLAPRTSRSTDQRFSQLDDNTTHNPMVLIVGIEKAGVMKKSKKNIKTSN